MLIFLPSLLQTPLPFLSPTFGSHMVLQRDKPNTFWGWTTPGSQVTVSINGSKATGTADASGKWMAKINPPKTGGPYTVNIDGSQHVKLDDVLVGDVWVCAGQSNMEFGLTMAKGGAEAAAAANNPTMRIFIAPHQATYQPMPTNGGTWKVCTPETVAQDGWGGFSAVGYFFGKALQTDLNVPIGLVGDYWGGTNAESWSSREGIKPLGDFDAWFPKIDASVTSANEVDGGIVGQWQSPTTDVSKWTSINGLPTNNALGLDDGWDGTTWFRTEFTLTKAQADAGGTLTLGSIDDADTTWINGTKVGGLNGYNTPRSYPLAAGVLKEGNNVLVVQVTDTAAFGGFNGPADQMAVSFADGSKVAVATGWKGVKGAKLSTVDPNIPTVLSNGMLEPMMPLAIKGAIWYQGENNAYRAEQYQRVLPAMIADWRRRFDQGDFPFYIVSLANFQAHKDQPGTDEWAELREAQWMTASNIKNSGIAMAIDIGDAVDIHPTDKKTVGDRLALVALAKTYGRKIEFQGPTYKSFSVKGSDLWLNFDHAMGLTYRNSPAGEFSIAGEDRVWHWAKAEIVNDSVVLSSPDVAHPVAARYAWQSNPTANLYNAAGLPMMPFRTDDWPRVTAGHK